MSYEKLDKKAKLSWRIGRIIGAIIITSIVCLASYFLRKADVLNEILIFSLVGVIILYLITSIILYPEIEYNQWRYLISEDKVEIRHGIFFVRTTIIPVIRIQHITTSQGPINRILGLHKVTISLASGTFEIECLSKEKSESISNNLKEKLYVRIEERGELL